MRILTMKTNFYQGHSKPTGAAVLKALALFCLGAFLAGCPAGKPSSESGSVEGKVVLKGSNTVGEELAPRLIAEYKKEQPKVTVELESKGTGSGLAALAASQCDIASAS